MWRDTHRRRHRDGGPRWRGAWEGTSPRCPWPNFASALSCPYFATNLQAEINGGFEFGESQRENIFCVKTGIRDLHFSVSKFVSNFETVSNVKILVVNSLNIWDTVL